MMDLISVVASMRATTEERVANDYTVRQLMHLMTVYMKDKTLVLNMVAASFSGKGKSTPVVGSSKREPGTPYPARLPQWFGRPKPGYRVVSMDEPHGKVMTAFGMGRMPGR